MCDRFPQKFDVQTSNTGEPSHNILGLIFVVNIKFPEATYHTIVPLTEELYCLNIERLMVSSRSYLLALFLALNLRLLIIVPRDVYFVFRNAGFMLPVGGLIT